MHKNISISFLSQDDYKIYMKSQISQKESCLLLFQSNDWKQQEIKRI